MTEKRYAIVRVDNMCPAITEEGIDICKTDKNCKNKCPYRYGDTKEQFEKKIAQVLFKKKLEIYKKVYGIIPNDKFMKEIYIKQLKVAKEIVEFLGVEE